MANRLMLRLLIAGLTFTAAVCQSVYGDSSEVLTCRLTSKLQKTESTSDAYIGAILDHDYSQDEYDGAISCQLEDQIGKVLGYVQFSIVVQHDPPTELAVHVSMSLRAKLDSLTMICRYADIGPELHVDNVIPENTKLTSENGLYQCGDGSNFKIVLTGLRVNPAKPRLKRYIENIMCSRFGTNPYPDVQLPVDEIGYCLMHNGTQGVYMFTESNGFQCSRCCENHVYKKKPLKMVCEPCPPGTHRKGYSYFGDCNPGSINEMQPLKQPPIQFKSLVNRTTTSMSVEWVLSEESPVLIDHFKVVLERDAYSSKSFSTNETSLTITDLTPDTSYSIVVTAVTAQKGKYLRSNILKVDTLFEVPSVEILNVTFSKDQILVTWTKQPEPALMLVLNCSLEEAKVSCDEETVGHVVPDSDRRFFLRLSCGGVYNLRAHYYDSTFKRHGPETDIWKFTVKGRPKFPPTELMVKALNTTSARIEWNDVPVVEGNPVKYYLLYCRKEASDMESVFRTNATSWELKSLALNTRYDVYITAVNSEGEGPFSETLLFQTLFEIPMIMNISLNQSSAFVHMSWKPQEEFDLLVQIVCVFENGSFENSTTPDNLGSFDFKLKSSGYYDVLIWYYDEKNDHRGPLSYYGMLEFTESGIFGWILSGLVTVILTIKGCCCSDSNRN